jgi:tetratricopeptide (TPR) repeat protein/TolB-like protein
MADVFVSYARSAEPKARRIADALGAAGYAVWWDRNLLPHHAFAQTIEAEIRAAKAVVVVWSRAALDSEWVRAEADLARHHGKLVQVIADGVVLPLPFNQIQAVDLSQWNGSGDADEWRKVLTSVEQLTSRPATTTPPSSRLSRLLALKPKHGVKLGLAALALLIVLSGAWVAFCLLSPPKRSDLIAIQTFETIGASPDLKNFAASLSDSLQNVLSQDQQRILPRADTEGLRGPDLERRIRALNVGMLFNGTVQADGGRIVVRTHLEDPIRHATLWGVEIVGSSTQPLALQAQVGARTVAVLNCSAQALNPKDGLADPVVLQTFLHACDLAETSHHGGANEQSGYAMLDAMRTVVREAPNFAAGHSVLAKHLAFIAAGMDWDRSAAFRQEADREARLALKLNPKDPDGYVALGLVAPPFDYRQRETLLRKALAADPAWPHANGFLANVMTEVGRLEEALTLYQQATAVNPQSLDWGDMLIHSLSWTGRSEQAEAEINRFTNLWPADTQLWSLRLHNLIAEKKWDEAKALLDRAVDSPGGRTASGVQWWTHVVDALKTRDRAAVQTVRNHALEKAHDSVPLAAETLTLLGFIDDAYAVTLNYDPLKEQDTSDFLFAPTMSPFRRDPRFMRLALKWRLPIYWRDTGVWPDFCADTTLPYDCRKEAAKAIRTASSP